jgi:hypothetical protein
MRLRRRTNFLWGLVALAAALLLLLQALQIVPPSLSDLLLRAWPAVLVLVGLSILLRGRMPLGSIFALVLSAGLVIGLALAAFTTRATQQRDDYRETVNQAIGADVTLLRLQIQALATDIELLPRLGTERVISGEFVGSLESQVMATYSEDALDANFSVIEQQANPFPVLSNVGRGTLRLELPANLPIDIGLQGAAGNVTLNLGGLAVERLNLELRQGDALVTLPVYDPLTSGREDMLGTLAVLNGNLTLFVDPAVAAYIRLNRNPANPPEYNPTTYNLLANPDALEARNFDVSEIVARYTAIVPTGRITLREPLQ